MEIEYFTSEHDDGYRIADWFKGGQATLDAAEAAKTKAEADGILTRAYLGPDTDGVTVGWVIN